MVEIENPEQAAMGALSILAGTSFFLSILFQSTIFTAIGFVLFVAYMGIYVGRYR